MLPVLSPSDFVDLTNQTLEFAYPVVDIEGEVKNLKVSRGRWVYFDIADQETKIKCFGSVYMLPGPVEDGMVVCITASPRLHNQYGFSLNISVLQFSGEGSIKKAADLLKEKLTKEGLFAEERKRAILYPPSRVGLITSEESAAYQDFIKVLAARFGGIDIELAEVQVQGNPSALQVSNAIEWFNRQSSPVDVLVIIRGGGSADDLQSFSSEQVTRSIASSRIPTLVAIGHESDVSLAELAADVRASTPSNAAEILVPDRREALRLVYRNVDELHRFALDALEAINEDLDYGLESIFDELSLFIKNKLDYTDELTRTLELLSPKAVLERGYALVKLGDKIITKAADVSRGDVLNLQVNEGTISAEVR